MSASLPCSFLLFCLLASGRRDPESMHHRLLLILVSLTLATDGLLLHSALGGCRPVIVQIKDDTPADVASWAAEDVSECCRNAGAAVLVVQQELLRLVVNEQERAQGDYPGPVPVVCDLLDVDGSEPAAATLAQVRAAGAAGVLLEARSGAEIVAAATSEQLESLILARSIEEVEIATAAGACAVICAFDGATATLAGAAHTVGEWEGEDEELQDLRAKGFKALFLRDGCYGDVRGNGAYCASRVRLALSKKSLQWGGSMFGATSNDVVPPAQRNPRMWAQSQRQAKEIMHESAKSRGLPTPDSKKK